MWHRTNGGQQLHVTRTSTTWDPWSLGHRKVQKSMDKLRISNWTKQETIRDSSGNVNCDRGRSLGSVCDLYRLGRGWCDQDGTSVSQVWSLLQTSQKYPIRKIPNLTVAYRNPEKHDQYRTALRQLTEGCDFATITPDEILRDHLVFGIRDTRARDYSAKQN